VTGTSGTGGAQRSRCLPGGPLGGGWVRQGAASVGARCRAHGGQERAQATQLAAGAAQRRHGISRCADRSAAGCAAWQYLFDHVSASHRPRAEAPRRGLARQHETGGTPARRCTSAAVTRSRLLQGAPISTKTKMDDQAMDAWTQED